VLSDFDFDLPKPASIRSSSASMFKIHRADVIEIALQPSRRKAQGRRRRQGKQQPRGADKAAREQEAKDKIAQEARDKGSSGGAAEEARSRPPRDQAARWSGPTRRLV